MEIQTVMMNSGNTHARDASQESTLCGRKLPTPVDVWDATGISEPWCKVCYSRVRLYRKNGIAPIQKEAK